MDSRILLKQIASLPEKAQEEVIFFVESLKKKYAGSTSKNEKRKGFGSWEGIQISKDFDDELEDFKDYTIE